MDTTDPLIFFDDEGICSHCKKYAQYLQALDAPEERARRLKDIVNQLQRDGRGAQYDCAMGISGGVDSSYLTWYATEVLELRPLLVHVDAGWNSELAVANIQAIVQSLKLDLHTLVVDWPSMRDVQRAYVLSGIANLDVPQDHAFIASLYTEAQKYGIRHILNGGNMQTESILPTAWGYDASDSRNLRAIHSQFGRHDIGAFPIMTFWQRFFYYPVVARLELHRPLEYISYSKRDAKDLLTRKFGWRDYGGKHYESRFTKFFQAHYLPQRYGYDKRLAHLSSLVVSGQMTRNEALAELRLPLYDPHELENDKRFFLKKLDVSEQEFERVMSSPKTDYTQFANSEKLRMRLRQVTKRSSTKERTFRSA